MTAAARDSDDRIIEETLSGRRIARFLGAVGRPYHEVQGEIEAALRARGIATIAFYSERGEVGESDPWEVWREAEQRRAQRRAGAAGPPPDDRDLPPIRIHFTPTSYPTVCTVRTRIAGRRWLCFDSRTVTAPPWWQLRDVTAAPGSMLEVVQAGGAAGRATAAAAAGAGEPPRFRRISRFLHF